MVTLSQPPHPITSFQNPASLMTPAMTSSCHGHLSVSYFFFAFHLYWLNGYIQYLYIFLTIYFLVDNLLQDMPSNSILFSGHHHHHYLNDNASLELWQEKTYKNHSVVVTQFLPCIILTWEVVYLNY